MKMIPLKGYIYISQGYLGACFGPLNHQQPRRDFRGVGCLCLLVSGKQRPLRNFPNNQGTWMKHDEKMSIDEIGGYFTYLEVQIYF